MDTKISVKATVDPQKTKTVVVLDSDAQVLH
jgi:hypothetical protein